MLTPSSPARGSIYREKFGCPSDFEVAARAREARGSVRRDRVRVRERVRKWLFSRRNDVSCYSYRSATIGSTFIARRAGRNAASSAIAMREMVAPINSGMSVGLMP